MGVGTRWLIHTEGRGSPHCVSCSIDADGKCTIWNKDKKYMMPIEKLNNTLAECVDHKGLVFFELNSRVDKGIVECDALLDLQAGADDD